MFVARIDGSITSTIKHKSLRGTRLLIGQRLEADGTEVGEPLVLVDDLNAGIGSFVLVTTDGDLARQKLADNTTPTRMIVVGIIDLAQGELHPGARA
ncbi:MAG: EutN/CcmL family microcompartment protein [Acidobacteria bacterium]|nr:EutN/CcmL family microcompartment protein [Acidobacteriota bacterium]